MNRSMPTMRPTPSTRSGRCEESPPASVARPAPVTPAAPLEAMIMNTSSEICSPTESGSPMAEAIRRRPHHHRQHAEHHSPQMPHPAQDRLTGAAHRLDREADEQGHEQGLEHLAGGQRGEQRVRDDPEQEVGGGSRLVRYLAGTGGCHLVVEPETAAGMDDVAHHQPDPERHGRHGQEVGQRQTADLADPAALATKPSPIGLSRTARSGATKPTRMPSPTATTTARYPNLAGSFTSRLRVSGPGGTRAPPRPCGGCWAPRRDGTCRRCC